MKSAHIYDELFCTIYRIVFKSSHHLRIFLPAFTELLRKIFTKILRGFTKLLRRFYEIFTKIFTKLLRRFYEHSAPNPGDRQHYHRNRTAPAPGGSGQESAKIATLGGNPLPTV